MRSIFIAFFLSSLFLLNPALAKDEALASFELASADSLTLRKVSLAFGASKHADSTYEVIVPESQIHTFKLLAPNTVLTDADTAATAQARLSQFKLQETGDNYHSFAEVQAWMKTVVTEHPTLAEIVPYGKSAQGRTLAALRLNANASTKPVLMITAATHGDELITTEVLIRLVNELVAGYGTDARFTKMIDQHDIYFVPVLNADGFAATRRYDGSVDPNRSYPYPGHENATPSPSIAAIIHLFETIHPAGTIDFHAFGQLTMYPWGYTRAKVAEPFYSKFENLTASMSLDNHYEHGNIADIIYVAPGSSADYYFWKTNSISLGIEMGQDKIPNPTQFPAYVRSQEESTWKFIESF